MYRYYYLKASICFDKLSNSSNSNPLKTTILQHNFYNFTDEKHRFSCYTFFLLYDNSEFILHIALMYRTFKFVFP